MWLEVVWKTVTNISRNLLLPPSDQNGEKSSVSFVITVTTEWLELDV
jgi:hypothetical protein